MLHREAEFIGFTYEDWTRFLYLWKPRAAPETEATRPRGGLLLIHDGERIRKLLSTLRGRLPLPLTFLSLEELAREHRASWGISAEIGALEEVMERFGQRLRADHDLTEQAILFSGVLRELISESGKRGTRIETWPRRLHGVPIPAVSMIHRAMDSLCGDGEALGMGIFKEGELWTAAVLRRRGTTFDLFAGPEEVRPYAGLLSGDWRRDVPHIVAAMEERVAPLALGCFAEVETFRALQVDPSPGAWGRAVAVRDVILSPMPTGVGVALGVDGARFAFEQTRQLVRRYDTSGRIRSVGKLGFERLFGAVENLLASREGNVEAALGFDPLAVLRLLLRR